MKNPITNAKILPNFNPLHYTKRSIKRGDKAFVMSRSQLHEFSKCPSKWIRGGGSEDESTTSTNWGTLIDCLLTQPDKFADMFSVRPNKYPSDDGEKPWNGNSKWCRKWIADQGGLIVISEETLREANWAVQRLKQDPNTSALLDGAKVQVFVAGEYHDRDTGLVIPVCGLIDVAPKADALVDIKTARYADLARWGRVVNEHWYDAQGAIYCDLWEAATGEKREEFWHVIQENSSPYEIAHASLSVEFLSMGRAKYRNALRLYAHCLATGDWLTYNGIATGLNIGGRNVVGPESWMQDAKTTGPIEDPDWMTEKAA